MAATEHKKQWEFLRNKFESGQLAHSYLFTGPEGIGKKDFAVEFAGFIGCKFPDLLVVSEPQEIAIAKIREVQNFLAYKSYYGGLKVVIVDNAEKMNQEAQSCFLKTLEEPKGQTLLILVSSRPDMLLCTITSRCQVSKFYKTKKFQLGEAEQKDLSEFLATANLNLAERFKYAKSMDFEQKNLPVMLKSFQQYLRRLLLSKTGVGELAGQEAASTRSPAFEKYSVMQIKNIIELTEDIYNKLVFTNASPKLALEILLMEI